MEKSTEMKAIGEFLRNSPGSQFMLDQGSDIWPLEESLVTSMADLGIFSLSVEFSLPDLRPEFDILLERSGLRLPISVCSITRGHIHLGV